MNLYRILLLVIITNLMPNQNFSQSLEFDNPIAEQRADPWVHRTDDGTYYFIATVPEYDRIVMRKSNTINGLKHAKERVVWHKHEKGVMGHHIWAPELHKIDGKWFIYFAAGEAENIWNCTNYLILIVQHVRGLYTGQKVVFPILCKTGQIK